MIQPLSRVVRLRRVRRQALRNQRALASENRLTERDRVYLADIQARAADFGSEETESLGGQRTVHDRALVASTGGKA